MTNQTWFIDVDLKLQAPVSDALLDDLIEAVEPLHGAIAAGRGPTLGLSLAVDTADAWEAAQAVREFLEKDLAQLVPEAAISSLRVLDDATRTAENEAPRFPPLVAVPDIAELLGVTRQQAHRLASRESFPTAALTPRTGPLWTRAAVESWNERTERHTGRPKVIVDESHMIRGSEEGRRIVESAVRATRSKKEYLKPAAGKKVVKKVIVKAGKIKTKNEG